MSGSFVIPPDLEPADDVERREAVRAVINWREASEAGRTLRDLTAFERALFARAYEAGRQDVQRSLDQVLGDAETIRVEVVRDAAARSPQLNPAATAVTNEEFIRSPHGWLDRRAALVAMDARRRAELEPTPPERMRDA